MRGLILILILLTLVFTVGAAECNEISYTLKNISHDGECFKDILIQIDKDNECKEDCFTEFDNFFLNLDNGFEKRLRIPTTNPYFVLLKDGHCEKGIPEVITIGIEDDYVNCFQRFDFDEELAKFKLYSSVKIEEEPEESVAVVEETPEETEELPERVDNDVVGFLLICLTLFVGVAMYFLVIRDKR
ncbi:hypothetical protein HN419_05885 [Candidatus Woesearchaeota archaeon]|jgi:hypothetical protein|nr:hypothetical protein [Candidatus Woesearchaeota archaeon]MBT3537599.1 hypothetical protein [Candidatus Woesearchaeota archaeon]MBT4696899.1 hypothetical protein [Candidatus Woesearchaeota archaeon]MBT4716419.1 hypothetical protein [Candidatus Woesearchaeota archaeon]MBT7105268.1 hypothetical protein [Candidatus Woesearchaeota archaeon]